MAESSERYMTAVEEESNTESKVDHDTIKTKNGTDRVVTKKGILLAVPLFCKFVVVLAIKFATDLVVFPLLFLYRMARLAKRRFMRLIGKGNTGNESL